ncbi:MAG: stage V sporulation protein AC [Clostridia bacterium]|nr:stage V sporulation protein AC [Clostridia bacterium]
MIDKQAYNKLVKSKAPKSKEVKTLVLAFVIGGFICCIGEAIHDLLSAYLPIGPQTAGSLTSVCMIFLGSLLTGLGVYDKIGRVAGAGSIVPITGFANSVVSPAMEFNREGMVLGVMSKMFVVSGPVIVSGVVASIIIGFIYWVVSMFA